MLPLPSREQVLLDLGHEYGEEDPALVPFLERIERYLEGIPVDLDDAWDQEVGTSFQRTVWRATQRIPRGQTRSYGQVAQAIGRPQSGRAVGQALASNPLPILIPCHRVVATDGSLRGFACGQEMKRRLLTLEGAAVSQCLERESM
ncbi:MAG: methylated-DNA--[protein]-cysteine S-methyltransferase [Dehalococcoidia bacterium]|nr:methylated-DNA--[protein]-cysteine S-methyltransferase [Dehalococcoidia bacterium]